FAITITPVDDAPTISANTGLATPIAGTSTISSTFLTAADVDNIASELTFTLTGVPSHGSLMLSGSAGSLVVGNTFTQTDINNSKLSYVNSSGTSDSFSFVVIDTGGASSAGTTFNFSVDSPTSVSFTGTTYNQSFDGLPTLASTGTSETITFAQTGP